MTSEDRSDPSPEPELPEEVRVKLIGWAADAIRATPERRLPPSLTPFAKFRKDALVGRARSQVAAVLSQDEGFRRAVLATLPDYAALVDSLRASEVPSAAAGTDVAALLYLDRPDGWRDLIAVVLAAGASQEVPAEPGVDVEPLRHRIRALESELAEERKRRRRVEEEARAEVEQVRKARRAEVSTARADADAQRAAARAAGEDAALLAVEADDLRAEVKKLKRHIEQLTEARIERRRDERSEEASRLSRLTVLLNALNGAARGLTEELALPAGLEPPASEVAGGAARPALRVGSTRDLDALLATPGLHLLVDGYNVTLTALQGVPLADQRTRLLRALGSLRSRTNAEITVVFDGSGIAAPAAAAPRGVRVAFSPPGITADDRIIDFLRAEPGGRVLAVVTDDAELQRRASGLGAVAVAGHILTGYLPSL